MPGLVGIITTRPREWAASQLRTMHSKMLHDPTYTAGSWEHPASGVYVAWTARKGSFAAHMPLQQPDKGDVLFFAGEEFSGPLPLVGRPNDNGAAETLRPTYLLQRTAADPAFPRSLNGRFHGLLIDTLKGSAKLFNDRFGMDRLYVHEGADAIYFSAEAKALLAVVAETRRPDMRSLGEFVTCGCVLENRSLFQGIHVLPNGSAWEFAAGKLVAKGTYFEPREWEELGSLDSDSYYERLRDVFARQLPRYFEGPGQVAISLTGGLDTRMIMAWAGLPEQTLPTYTFGGPFRECHDVRIARKIAEVAHQQYQVIPVGDEYLSKFGQYAERAVYLTDGCVAVTRGADLYANELAAQIAPIRLTGNYGSEILRRLRAFKAGTPSTGLFTQEFMAHVVQAHQTYQKISSGHAVSFTAFRQAPWYQYSLLALEQTQVSVRSPFLDNEVVEVAFQAPDSRIVKKDLFEDSDHCTRLIADGDSRYSQIPTDRGLGGQRGVRGAMLRAMREFSFKAEYSYDYGMPQWLARTDHLFSRLHLERAILGRHKFTHFRVWYRDRLAAYVRDMLLDPRSLSRPYLEPRVVESMVTSHLKGTGNFTTEITRLLTLELQHRLFFDAS